jgi:predicted component of type VI protein secretion system
MPYIRIYLNDVLTDQVELKDDAFFIGRDSNNSIVIDNAGVSSYHAVIEKEGDSYYIIDNNSTNGVFVNGKKITRQALEYWDEIQIYNYVLKFMAVSGLQESEDPDIAQDGKPGQAGTMEVDISDVQDLLKLRDQKKVAYLKKLTAKGTHTRVSIKGDNFSIGRSRESDLRTSGWFSPAVVAEIKRQTDGYYLVTHNNKNVLINGKPPEESTKLSDGDKLRVRNLFMTFYHRLINNKK